MASATDFFYRQTAQTIKEYNMFEPNESVLVCVSGGADSMALFYVLAYLREKLGISELFALHVNHNLRDSAASDEEFVKKMCESHGISLKIHSEDVRKLAKSQKMGIEEAARQVRYTQAEIAASGFGASKIAVAHNKNDNAETVLMNLCRGSGLRGLTGIPFVSGRVVRPLIKSPRCEILAYLNENGFPYVHDETNESNDYTRNRVRNIILPELHRSINPQAANHISKTAALLAIDDDYLNREAVRALAECGLSQGNSDFGLPGAKTNSLEYLKLDVKKINKLHYSISSRVMRQILELFGGEVNQTNIEALIKLSKNGAGRLFKSGAMCGVKKYEYVEFTRNLPLQKEFCKKIVLETLTPIPELGKTVFVSRQKFYDFPRTYCTKLLKCVKMYKSFEFRSRRRGDRLSLATKGGRVFTRKLQDFFTDLKIPAGERDIVPLFVVENKVAWVVYDTGKPDFGITCSGFSADGNEDLLYVTIGGFL